MYFDGEVQGNEGKYFQLFAFYNYPMKIVGPIKFYVYVL